MISKSLINKIIDQNKSAIRSFGVKKLGLFGSVIREQADNESDIDFIVEFIEGKKNFDNFIELSFLLEDLFHRKVDLATLESLSANLKSHIFKEVEYFEV